LIGNQSNPNTTKTKTPSQRSDIRICQKAIKRYLTTISRTIYQKSGCNDCPPHQQAQHRSILVQANMSHLGYWGSIIMSVEGKGDFKNLFLKFTNSDAKGAVPTKPFLKLKKES